MAVRTALGLTGTTASQIATSLERALAGGRFAAGDRLPPVRTLAAALGVSAATVASAYRTLHSRGLVVGDGRRGTKVRYGAEVTSRLASAVSGEETLIDLGGGNPDPDLLPPLGPALRTLDVTPRIYGTSVQMRGLTAFAASEFAADHVPSAHIAVLGGGLDAIERLLREHLRPGDRVGVEDPVLPALRDLVETSGYVAEPIAVDAHGPAPDATSAALRRRLGAVIITPRAQNPTGAALSSARAVELRRLLAAWPDVLLIENDAAGPVAGAPYCTLAAAGRERWAAVRSMSKFLGPDLRLAVVAGDAQTMARVQRRQMLGTRWVSHLLQQLALALWSDPGSGRLLARASETYGARRAAFLSALATHGITAAAPSGFNVWLPVREEAPVVQALAQRGWMVAAGERFRMRAGPGIRITTSALREEDAARLARDVAEVQRPPMISLG
jgi:DNA-binding transcriptional MocR family regulator